MKVVITHGTFDIIHYGHINYLEKAKKYGDKLIVLVTSDEVAKLHGKTPYFSEDIRMKMIASLKVVDEVILRKEKITNSLLKKLKGDVLVTTDDKLIPLLEKDIMVVLLPRTKGISTTQIKEKLKKEES